MHTTGIMWINHVLWSICVLYILIILHLGNCQYNRGKCSWQYEYLNMFNILRFAMTKVKDGLKTNLL